MHINERFLTVATSTVEQVDYPSPDYSGEGGSCADFLLQPRWLLIAGFNSYARLRVIIHVVNSELRFRP